MLEKNYRLRCDASHSCDSLVTATFKSTVRQRALGLGWHRQRGILLGDSWYCPKCRADAANQKETR